MGIISFGEDRTHWLRIIVIWAVISIIGIIIAFIIPYPPGATSVQGDDQSTTLKILTILAMPVFVGVCVMTLYSAIVFRQRGPELVDGPPMMGNVPVQVAWIAISSVIVLSLAVLGIVTLTNSNVARAVGAPGRAIGSQSQTGAQPIETENKELQVQVIGQEWFFTYRFPDYGGVETTHLELPVGVPVEIHVTSLDVIHSWWAYQLGVKADANQGVDNVFHVTPQEIGSFQVRCAELCGLWHGEMSDSQGKVVSQADWQSWISDQQAAFKDTIKYLPKYAPSYFPEPLTKGA